MIIQLGIFKLERNLVTQFIDIIDNIKAHNKFDQIDNIKNHQRKISKKNNGNSKDVNKNNIFHEFFAKEKSKNYVKNIHQFQFVAALKE